MALLPRRNRFLTRKLIRRIAVLILLISITVPVLVAGRYYGYLFRSPPPPPNLVAPASRDVSRAIILGKIWRDNVNWVYKLVPDWTPFLYTMNNEPGYGLSVPANVGREAMPFLTFIIDHYDTLPQIMAFMHPTNYQWHNDIARGHNLDVIKSLRLETVQRQGYVNLRCDTEPGCPTAVRPFEPSALDLKQNNVRAQFPGIYMELFNVSRDKVPKVIGGICCAQFAVSRERVLQRPREDYVRMRKWLMTAPFDSISTAWVFEKVWHIVFGQEAVYCPPPDKCYCDVFGRCI